MNLNYGDTNLEVRYLEAFLQNEYSTTLRVSGIYDAYTHETLIEYNNLPKVEDSNSFYDHLIKDFGDYLKDFKVNILSDSITFLSKSVSQLPELQEDMDALRKNGIFLYARQYGWSITKFVSYVSNTERYTIEFSQDNRKNLIPADAISLINLSTSNILTNTILGKNSPMIKKDSTGEKCCMIVPCLPDTEYILIHRFETKYDPEDPTIPIYPEIVIGSSPYQYPNLKELSNNIANNKTIQVEKGVSTIYKTSDVANSIILCYDYDRVTYNKSILVIKKPSNYNEDFAFINTSAFILNYWLVNTKYMDYILGSSICEYSDEEDIAYAQDLLDSICKDYHIDKRGIYTENFRDAILRYQHKRNINFALGYIDVETESLMQKDLESNTILTIYS